MANISINIALKPKQCYYSLDYYKPKLIGIAMHERHPRETAQPAIPRSKACFFTLDKEGHHTIMPFTAVENAPAPVNGSTKNRTINPKKEMPISQPSELRRSPVHSFYKDRDGQPNAILWDNRTDDENKQIPTVKSYSL